MVSEFAACSHSRLKTDQDKNQKSDFQLELCHKCSAAQLCSDPMGKLKRSLTVTDLLAAMGATSRPGNRAWIEKGKDGGRSLHVVIPMHIRAQWSKTWRRAMLRMRTAPLLNYNRRCSREGKCKYGVRV